MQRHQIYAQLPTKGPPVRMRFGCVMRVWVRRISFDMVIVRGLGMHASRMATSRAAINWVGDTLPQHAECTDVRRIEERRGRAKGECSAAT